MSFRIIKYISQTLHNFFPKHSWKTDTRVMIIRGAFMNGEIPDKENLIEVSPISAFSRKEQVRWNTGS